MYIIVTRHGQTDWNALERVQGQTDIELNDIGKKQAEKTGELIKNEKIDLIITSPLKRARETAEIINLKIGVPIIEENRLMERYYGKSEGLTKKEIKKIKETYPEIMDVWNYNKNININEIERMDEFCNRIYQFLDDITNKYKDKKYF